MSRLGSGEKFREGVPTVTAHTPVQICAVILQRQHNVSEGRRRRNGGIAKRVRPGLGAGCSEGDLPPHAILDRRASTELESVLRIGAVLKTGCKTACVTGIRHVWKTEKYVLDVGSGGRCPETVAQRS